MVLLATLLSRAPHAVSFEQLMGELWEDEPPVTARTCVHVYVSRLRKILHRSGRRDPIMTEPTGYSLRLGDDQVDVQLFQRDVKAGRDSLGRGRSAEALMHFEAAIGRWRGPALGGLTGGPLIDGAKYELEAARRVCFELLIEAKLMSCRHDEAITLLYSLIGENPCHESFYRQLMIALYHVGRRTDALNVYSRARSVFKAELGVEPGQALRDVFQSVVAESVEASLIA